ncbi:MAG: N-acetylmuramoyl-L-alanine amidase [Acidimicrobiales bacterium]
MRPRLHRSDPLVCPRHNRRTFLVLLTALAALAALLTSCNGMTLVSTRTRRHDADKPTPVDVTKFAPGACVRYPPLVGDRHTTVFLDAGHGGIDPGAIGVTETGATIEEANETLPVELDTMALLRVKGFTVVVSRTRASTVVRLSSADVSGDLLTLQGAFNDVAVRDVCANMAKAAVLVGIYFNFGSSPSNAGSLTAYDANRPFAKANLRLATLMQSDTLAAMNAKGWGIPDEGTLPDTGLGSLVPTDSTGGLATAAANYDHLLLLGPAEAGYFSTPSDMPGALIEPLFATDPFEGSIVVSSIGQQTIAQGIATAIEQYFTPAPSSSSALRSRRRTSSPSS